MPTFRSHSRHAPQQDDSKSNIPRRVTAAKTNDGTESMQSKAVQHVSKLARRASRSITTSDRLGPEHSTTTIAKEPTPMTAAPPQPRAASKRLSVAPTSDIPQKSDAASTLRHKVPPQYLMARTSSLVSRPTTHDTPKSFGLRRKPSIINKYAAKQTNDIMLNDFEDRITIHRGSDVDDKPLQGSIPPYPPHPVSTFQGEPSHSTTHSQPRAPFGEVSAHRDTVTPPVSNYAYAQTATPSTRYTDSPFSHVPTPSSVSSYSSELAPTTSHTPRSRLQSPTIQSRPPVARNATEKGDTIRTGLPLVRESSTSSSNSVVRPSYVPKPTVIKEDVPRRASRSYDAPTSSSRNKAQREKETHTPLISAKRLSSSVRIPPELAHLNVDLPGKASANKAPPPTRPSRDGTSSLPDIAGPSPVVKSDLPRLYTTYHKRTSSLETPSSTTSPGQRSGFGNTAKALSRQTSPRVDSAISPPPSAQAFSRGPTPEVPVATERRRLKRKDSPAIVSAPSPSKSPLRFFSRKPKVEAEKPQREPRKGPAAGTGHEGYGRFGFRGRSGSVTSTNVGRSPSTESISSAVSKPSTKRKSSFASSKDGFELDDFLRERLNPVVLRGSGSTFSNTATSSEFQAPSIPASSTSSSLESYPTPQLLPSAMRSSEDGSPNKRPPPSSRLRSSSSDDDGGSQNAFRERSQGVGTTPPTRALAPLKTSIPPNEWTIVSNDDSALSTDDPFGGREGLWLRSSKVNSAVKPARKWNFFQRAHASPRPNGKGKAIDTAVEPERDQDNAMHRSVAHYALLDMVEPVGLEEVERLVHENDTSTEDSTSDSQFLPKMVPYERRHTSLLPSPPVEASRGPGPRSRPTPTIVVPQGSPVQTHAVNSNSLDLKRYSIDMQQHVYPEVQRATPQLEHHTINTPDFGYDPITTPERLSINNSPRQPRLSPVGRIPRVVSKRDRDRKLPDNSFSRPFARTQPHPNVKPPGALYNHIRSLASPIESASQPTSSTSTGSDAASAEPKNSTNTYTPSIVSTNRTSMDMYPGNDLFMFSQRKDSDMSYSSSNASWMAALAAQPTQEDPWHEYNDLMDDMMPLRTPLSAASSFGLPFQYSDVLAERSSSVPQPLNIETFSQPFNFDNATSNLMPARDSISRPMVLSVPQQIARFMQPSLSPLATPHTICDFVDQYNRSSIATSARTSLGYPLGISIPQSHRTSLPGLRGSLPSSRLSRSSTHSRSASLPENNARNSQSWAPSVRFSRDTQLLDIAEDDGDADQSSKASLRFGALMTSRWLSFGQVLFSPAHNEMRLADEPRVLIVDGLGSDWSYYVALNYPSATVYSLGSSAANGAAGWTDAEPPSNHRHIAHASIDTAFPFPKGFFTAVVFRFPSAATEDKYQECMSECKRVLRPGGYLEVAVLDLDLMNMGSQARRDIRDLKMRMQQLDENINLRNMSDVLVRLIGRRGFESIQRCIVGVPVAGRIPSSREMSSTSSSSDIRPLSWDREGQTSPKQELSFADLLKDARAGQFEAGKINDENITKMVAKVGRWWYSTCYEKSLLQTNRSIWDDRTLLRECEKQGTSFRLLICHAQKPAQTRRRTVSV